MCLVIEVKCLFQFNFVVSVAEKEMPFDAGLACAQQPLSQYKCVSIKQMIDGNGTNTSILTNDSCHKNIVNPKELLIVQIAQH